MRKREGKTAPRASLRQWKLQFTAHREDCTAANCDGGSCGFGKDARRTAHVVTLVDGEVNVLLEMLR